LAANPAMGRVSMSVWRFGESEIVAGVGVGQSGLKSGVRADQWVDVSESGGLFNSPMPMWDDSAVMLCDSEAKQKAENSVP